MRYAALERDDSVLTFTGFFSLLLHALFLLFVAFPDKEPPKIEDHIFPTVVTYQNFPTTQEFLTFSATRRVFTASATGLIEPTSGTVRVPAESIRQARSEDRRTVGPALDVPAPVPERTVYGAATDAPNASSSPSPSPAAERRNPTSRLRSFEMPDAPVGIIRDYEPVPREAMAPSATSSSRSSTRSSSSDLRSSSSGDPRSSGPAPQPGVAHVPDPTSLRPSAPRSGETREPRSFADPRSSGPTVSPTPSEVALPTSAPDAPSGGGRLGRRRILYKPLPTYPEWAERENVQANVVFHVSVGPDGRVNKAYVARSSNYPDLDRLAEASVRRWLWEPRPGSIEEGTATVKFMLKSGSQL